MSLVKHQFRLKDGTKKETKFFYYRFIYKGKTYMQSTKTSNRAQAEKIEKKAYESLIDKLELGVKESITLQTAITNYIASVRDTGQFDNKVSYTNKILGSKTAVHTKDKKTISIFGIDGETSLEKIDNAMVGQLVLSRKREGNKSGTILGELSVLSQIIEINRQLRVPVPMIDFKDVKKLNQLKPSKGKLRYLSKVEETALLAELHPDKVLPGVATEQTREQRQDLYDLVIVLLDTGCRHGEACVLTWDDIDLKERTVNVYRNKVKNQSILHCTKRLFEVLNRRYDSTDSKHVFTAKDGGARKYSKRAFVNACERAGVENCGFHTLRHTFASRLVQRGLSLMEVSQLLGHKSISTTAIYAHLVPNQAAKRASMLLEEV